MVKIREWRAKSGKWWQTQTDTQRKTARILAGLVGVALVFALPSAFLSDDWAGLFLNLGTELGGAVVTFVLINRVIGGSEERERLKADLISHMRSRVSEVAIQAVEELRRHGWLADGSLQDANLQYAILHDANLENADLTRANLWFANLQQSELSYVHLQEANLQCAYLYGGDLTGANLDHANLEGTKLMLTVLQDANLQYTNLQEANLQGADLEGADLHGAQFNETTVLPDATNWTPGTDMARFTDSNCPDFWRSDYRLSSSENKR